QRLDMVLTRQLNLKVKPEKCQFYKQLWFLGYLDSEDGISPDPEKTRAVRCLRQEVLNSLDQVGHRFPAKTLNLAQTRCYWTGISARMVCTIWCAATAAQRQRTTF
ncbi:hypothetical protein LSAT2_021819, partial [Lamellibrachia satsuma]